MSLSVVGYGSWFEHVQEFWDHRLDSNVLFLKYEDMYKVLKPRLTLPQHGAAPADFLLTVKRISHAH